MATIFFRTLAVYALLIVTLRLMGKRQIGELEVSDLVVTLLISEIATLPIEEPELPILFAVVPIVTLLFVEVLSSVLLIRFPFLRNLLSTRPAVLVRDGRPIEKELRRMRISLEELISALRRKDVGDLSEVRYAILEPNGQISVLKKAANEPPDAETLGIAPKDAGIARILIADGKRDRHNLRCLPAGSELLKAGLRAAGLRRREVFLMTVDDLGTVRTVPKRRAERRAAKKRRRAERKAARKKLRAARKESRKDRRKENAT